MSQPPDLLKSVMQFKKLDQKKSRGEPLTAGEEARYEQLRKRLKSDLLQQEEPPPVQEAERRETELRVPSEFEVVFSDKSAFRDAYIKNISGWGLYVETERLLPLNTEVPLVIKVGDDKTIKVTGKVAWLNSQPSGASRMKPGMGMRLLDLTTEQERTIHNLVYSILEKTAKSMSKLEGVKKDSAAQSSAAESAEKAKSGAEKKGSKP